MNAKLGRVDNDRYGRGVGGVSQLDHPGGVTPLCLRFWAQESRTFSPLGPFGPCPTSNVTVCPS